MAEGDPIIIPKHGIMCFHCGEVFTTYGDCINHFGATPEASAGCLIDRVAIEGGGSREVGRGLQMELRKVEAACDRWRSRALALEEMEESFAGLQAELQRRFGTTSPWLIADELSNARFRAEHAMKLLDAAGIPFDQPVSGVAP